MKQSTAGISIYEARAPSDISAVRTLFEEYAAALRVDICFQNFSKELAELPGAYAPPSGRLLLASVHHQVAGCVALRVVEQGVCEMKRLYVRPAFRGMGIGRLLAERIIADGKKIGYQRMWLDTLPFMTAALRLYESLGFVRRSSYYDTPIEETVFMELTLDGRS